jgi:regulator of sirC expression with transglutaminase-like and TPR domain
MLHNLKEIHTSQEDWSRLIAVQNRLIVLLPQTWSEHRDRGLAHAELGQLDMALADLDTYLVNAKTELDMAAIAGRVAELRRASN